MPQTPCRTPTLPDIPNEVSLLAEHYAQLSGKPAMVVGSTALAAWGVPVKPQDIDIVLSRAYCCQLQELIDKLRDSEKATITYFEEPMPVFGHQGEQLDWSLCYDSTVVVLDKVLSPWALPCLGTLLILCLKKLDDALCLASASFADPHDKDLAEHTVFCSFRQIEAIVMICTDWDLVAAHDAITCLHAEWFIPAFPRLFQALGHFVSVCGTIDGRTLPMREVLQSIMSESNEGGRGLSEELHETISMGGIEGIKVVHGKAGADVSFQKSGNVYRLPSSSLGTVLSGVSDDLVTINACSDVRIVHFQITDHCSLRCSHCLFEKGASSIDFNTAKNLLSEFAEAGLLEVDFGERGEATFHPRLSDLMRVTAETYGLIPNLTTNLSMPLGDKVLNVIREVVGTVAVSIDRYHFGNFVDSGLPYVVRENLAAVLDTGVAVCANYVYTTGSFWHICRDLEWLAAQGIKETTLLRLFPPSPSDSAVVSSENLATLLKLCKTLDMNVGFAMCDPILNSPALREACKAQGYREGARCSAGSDFVFVDLKGRVGPCGYCHSNSMIAAASFEKTLKSNVLTRHVTGTTNMLDCPYRNKQERR